MNKGRYGGRNGRIVYLSLASSAGSGLSLGSLERDGRHAEVNHTLDDFVTRSTLLQSKQAADIFQCADCVFLFVARDAIDVVCLAGVALNT